VTAVATPVRTIIILVEKETPKHNETKAKQDEKYETR
jgi:hypothetical protein